MKKLKGLAAVFVGALVQPELRPAEVKVARAVFAALTAYLGYKGYQNV